MTTKEAITAKKVPLAKIDLGIVKYNFEAASGHKCKGLLLNQSKMNRSSLQL